MAIEENRPAATAPGRTAYGRIVRERGTLKIVLAALALTAIWYVYDTIRVNRMLQVKWPPLQPIPNGLTVLGIHDKDRPGRPKKYETIQANFAWRIRIPDDAEEEEGSSFGAEDPDSPEARDRGNDPGASRHVSRGRIVDVEELMQSCPVVLTGAHFTGAWLEERTQALLNRRYWIVHVNLSDEGRSRYWQYSREHNGESLAFILGGEIVTCPEMHHMNVSHLSIQPIWIKEDAQKLADFINNQK